MCVCVGVGVGVGVGGWVWSMIFAQVVVNSGNFSWEAQSSPVGLLAAYI